MITAVIMVQFTQSSQDDQLVGIKPSAVGSILATNGVTPGAPPAGNGERLDARQLMTFQAPLVRSVSEPLLVAIGEALDRAGVKWWISPDSLPDVVIMAEMPAEESGDSSTYAGLDLPQQHRAASQTPRHRT